MKNILLASLDIFICIFAVAGCGGGKGENGLVLPFCYPKHYSRACYNGDVYWHDSCGGREDKYEECGANACSNGSCSAPTTWSKTYSGDAWTGGVSIVALPDSGYIAAGIIYPTKNEDMFGWALKIDAQGNQIWAKTFEENIVGNISQIQIIQSGDGGYAFAGTIDDGDSYDGWVSKYDADGNRE